ncbi:MAG: hypothetical protein R3C20_25420, partial [Planctomycetaceae bacterium]
MHTELATVPDFTLQRHSRQPGDSEGLFVLMQADFWNTLAKRANEIEAAINANDSAALSELVNDVAECLSGIEPGLNLNIGGPDPFHLAIIPLPGAEQVAETF